MARWKKLKLQLKKRNSMEKKILQQIQLKKREMMMTKKRKMKRMMKMKNHPIL